MHQVRRAGVREVRRSKPVVATTLFHFSLPIQIVFVMFKYAPQLSRHETVNPHSLNVKNDHKAQQSVLDPSE